MPHSIPAFANALAAVLDVVCFGGGFAIVLSQHGRHAQLASLLLRAGLVITCAFPILWAYGSPYPLWKVALACAVWGAVIGVFFYGVILWFRNEAGHTGNDSRGP